MKSTIIKDELNGQDIIKIEDIELTVFIPADKSNADYMAWLETEDGKAHLALQKASK